MTRDVRHALRALVRRPAFSLVVLLTLALGIGGVSAVFSVVNAALLRPLPFADGERLLRVRAGSLSPEGEPRFYSMSDVELLALRAEAALFERVLAARPGSATRKRDPHRRRPRRAGLRGRRRSPPSPRSSPCSSLRPPRSPRAGSPPAALPGWTPWRCCGTCERRAEAPGSGVHVPGGPGLRLKSFALADDMLYALVLVRFRRVRYVACADCVPDVVEDNLLRNILPGNVLWLLACLPLGIAGLVASRRPGHSEEVKRLLAGAAPGAGPAPSAAAGS